jgi:nucleotide-binding universal stress UspA family protein
MYKKILVPVDGSDSSLRGLSEAIKIAKESGAQVRLVHAVNEYFIDTGYGLPFVTPELINLLRDGGTAILNSAASKAKEQGLQTETVLLDRIGTRIADLILENAKAWPADLIVMGTHGRRGLSRLAMGSDAEMVLRSATVPVLMVRSAPPEH